MTRTLTKYVLAGVTFFVAFDARCQPAMLSSPKAAETNSIFSTHFVINSGVVLLNPYEVTKTNTPSGQRLRLDNADGTQAKFFIDLAMNYVWAWDVTRRARFVEEIKEKRRDNENYLWFWQCDPAVDVQTHLAYYAKDGNETSASAIVGSGNFGAELTLGYPVFRAVYTESGEFPQFGKKNRYSTGEIKSLYTNTISSHWAGLVTSYDLVTDSSAFDVHSRLLFGAGYRAAFKTPTKIGELYREAALSITVGAARVDSVQFLDDSTRFIKVHHVDVPDYHETWVAALETELYYPINGSINAFAGARIYSGLDPNPWTAHFGLTVPLDKLTKVFTGND